MNYSKISTYSNYICMTCFAIAALMILGHMAPVIWAAISSFCMGIFSAMLGGDVIFGYVVPLVLIGLIFIFIRDVAMHLSDVEKIEQAEEVTTTKVREGF